MEPNLNIEPVYTDEIPVIIEENKLYISKNYGVAIHLCLCGCKNKTVTRIKEGSAENEKDCWGLLEVDGKVTLVGSIGNYQFPCKSHYLITNNLGQFIIPDENT